MDNKIFHHPVQIYYEDTDHSGVVYHPNFLKYFERAREHVIGSDQLAMLWDEYGLGFAVYKSNVTYQEGVYFADIIDIRTSFKIDGKFKTLWRQEVWRKDAKRAAVVADIEMVCMDKNKQLVGIPQGVEEELLRRIAE